MTIHQQFEKTLVEEFIFPLINDSENFEYIYQQFVNIKNHQILKSWLLFKYSFEYNGEFQVRSEKQEFFSQYLLDLIVTIIKSKKLSQS